MCLYCDCILEHLQMAQQIAIFSYFVESIKKTRAPIRSLPRSSFCLLTFSLNKCSERFSLSRSLPPKSLANVFSRSTGSSDTGSHKNPASASPAHSLISYLLFQTLVPLLQFPHLIRSTIASTFRLRFSSVRFFFFFL